MGRTLTLTALILTAGATIGCYPCMQNSYYDPSCGVVYGPSVKPPTFLSRLGKNKHEKHSCPLCTTEAGPHATSAYYGAAFGQPTSAGNGHFPGCGCQTPQNCSSGYSVAAHSRNCSDLANCNCATPIANCDACSPCQHHVPASNCDTCATYGESYSGGSYLGDGYSGVIHDQSFSAEPMILPGDTVLPETFSSGSCPHCNTTSGPIFEGTIIHDHESHHPHVPTPAPAAEPALETAPGEVVRPEPDPLLPTTMMIPTFPAPRPARQVHWVPNALK